MEFRINGRNSRYKIKNARVYARSLLIIRRSRDVEISRRRGVNLRSSDAALPSAIPPKFDPLTFAHEAIVAYTNHRTVSIQQTLGLSMCKHLINRALSYKGLGPVCVKLHEPHASLSAEVIETDVCVVDSKGVEQIEDGLGHHRRTSSEVAYNMSRNLVPRGSCRTSSSPHRVHFVSARRGPH